MEWLEIIELRTAIIYSEKMFEKLNLLIKSLKKEYSKCEIRLYKHIDIKTDFSIHILHFTEEVNNIGSDLGLIIVESIKTFGIVNHCIWKEITNNKNIK